MQWGLEYQTLKKRTHWNTKHFEDPISNGSVLEWWAIAIAIVSTILKQNHWKSKQNGGHFVQISNGFGQMPALFVQNRTPLENRTEGYHWNSESIRYSSPVRNSSPCCIRNGKRPCNRQTFHDDKFSMKFVSSLWGWGRIFQLLHGDLEPQKDWLALALF